MPTTSSVRPVSDSQRRLLRNLVTERRTGFTADSLEIAFASMTSREASRIISQMMDAPRSRSAERRFFTESDAAPRYEESSEELPIVQTATREGRMLSAGRLHMTVTLPSGEHVALRARNLRRTRDSVSGWQPVPYGTEGSRIRVSTTTHTVGWVTGGSISWRPRITRDVQNAVRAMFGITGHESNRANWEACGYSFAVEDRCGRCARPLTDPESIARGIGPECFGRMTASVHAQVIEEAASERFEAARDSFDSHSLIHGTFPTSWTDEQVPAPPSAPVLTEDVKEARETIAEALDAYCSDTERDSAMRVFDELVAKTAAQLVLEA